VVCWFVWLLVDWLVGWCVLCDCEGVRRVFGGGMLGQGMAGEMAGELAGELAGEGKGVGRGVVSVNIQGGL
jgi:hypothetical protein